MELWALGFFFWLVLLICKFDCLSMDLVLELKS